MDYLNIEKNIKKFRCFLVLTQFEVAQETCSQTQISKVESGIGVPSSYASMIIPR